MGNARWSDSDFRTYANRTNYQAASRDKLFAHAVSPNLDPREVKVGKGPRKGQQLRESMISEENPNPTPIILGLDVTGSMGVLAEKIAKTELPKLMTQIHEQKIVSDPHVMFMGIDDVYAQGHGALQVSQFEPDLRIIEQLRQMWLVGNGGGNGSESYDLAWYFAGHHTYLENFEKTGKKGFLFTFGDEPAPFKSLDPNDLELIFGEGEYEETSPSASLAAAQRKFSVFHIAILKHGSTHEVMSSWTSLLGPNAIFVNDFENITDVVLATLAISNGARIHHVIEKSGIPEVLTFAFQNALKGK